MQLSLHTHQPHTTHTHTRTHKTTQLMFGVIELTVICRARWALLGPARIR
jgi:hypothetical protein